MIFFGMKSIIFIKTHDRHKVVNNNFISLLFIKGRMNFSKYSEQINFLINLTSRNITLKNKAKVKSVILQLKQKIL